MPSLDPATLTIDPRKIRDYLLASDHPRGAAKARFFRGLGFARRRPWELAEELRTLVIEGEIVGQVETPHGAKYVVDGALRGAQVRTVWIVDPPGPGIRFVTAYPVGRR